MPFGHDIIKQNSLLTGCGKCFFQHGVVVGRNDHGLVGQYMDPLLDGLEDVLGLLGIVARNHHHIAWLFGEHLLQEIAAGIDFLFPAGGIFGAAVVIADPLKVALYLRTLRGIDMHYTIHLVVHGLLDQASMKMARIEIHQFHFSFKRAKHGISS